MYRKILPVLHALKVRFQAKIIRKQDVHRRRRGFVSGHSKTGIMDKAKENL